MEKNENLGEQVSVPLNYNIKHFALVHKLKCKSCPKGLFKKACDKQVLSKFPKQEIWSMSCINPGSVVALLQGNFEKKIMIIRKFLRNNTWFCRYKKKCLPGFLPFYNNYMSSLDELFCVNKTKKRS